jgi:anti-sigma factor RsiW
MTGHPGEERLNDWVDGLLDAEQAAQVEAHVAQCPTCADAVDGLRRLLALAAEMPASIEPPAGTWDAVAERTVHLGRRRREVLFGLRVPIAAAALLLMALGAGLTATLLRQSEPPAAALGAAGGPDEAASMALVAAESEYDRTFQQLIAEYRNRQPQLDTTTIRVVGENLLIIDQALERARAALGVDPANQELPLLITDTHRKRIELVERALRLSARSERSEA